MKIDLLLWDTSFEAFRARRQQGEYVIGTTEEDARDRLVGGMAGGEMRVEQKKDKLGDLLCVLNDFLS